MVLVFYVFLTILILLNSLTKKKYENALWIIAIILIWFLCVFVNDDYVDWDSYQQMFISSTSLYYTKDIGFGILCFFLKSMGLQSISLRMVIYTLGFTSLYFSLRKYKINKLLFLAFYTYYPLPSDAIHLRTCIVSFILIFAISSYIEDKNWIKYVILILIATTFHKMAVLYLAMVMVNKVEKDNRFTKGLITIVGISIIIFGSNKKLISLLFSLLIKISGVVELGNLTNSVGAGIRRGWMIDWAVQLSFLILLLYIKLYFNRKYPGIEHPSNAIFWVNVIALIFLPLYFVSFDYFRMFRSMLALNYIAFCLYIDEFKVESIHKIPLKKIVAIMLAFTLIIGTGYVKVGYRGRASEEFYNFYYNDHISFFEYKEKG